MTAVLIAALLVSIGLNVYTVCTLAWTWAMVDDRIKEAGCNCVLKR